MFKKVTALGAILFSTYICASASTLVTCPDIHKLENLRESCLDYPIIPGKLYLSITYTGMKVASDKSNDYFLFVGPIKASHSDHVCNMVPTLVKAASPQGNLEYTDEGPICTYDSGVDGLYVTIGIINDSLKTKFIKSFRDAS